MSRENRKFKHQAVVDAVLAKLRVTPNGTETSTSELVATVFGNCKYDYRAESEYKYAEVEIETLEYFDIDRRIRREARMSGIRLDDSRWSGMGLPFHSHYIVRHMAGGAV